jgi:hypothetical protein
MHAARYNTVFKLTSSFNVVNCLASDVTYRYRIDVMNTDQQCLQYPTHGMKMREINIKLLPDVCLFADRDHELLAVVVAVAVAVALLFV